MKTSPLALMFRAESNFDDIDLAIPPPIPIMPDTPTHDPRLVLNANFRKDGPPICGPFEYYYTTANFILEMGAAHADTPFRGLTLSYPFSRVTWSIGPTSIAAAEEGRFTTEMAVAALVALAGWQPPMRNSVPLKAIFDGMVLLWGRWLCLCTHGSHDKTSDLDRIDRIDKVERIKEIRQR